MRFLWLLILLTVSACVETAHAPEVEVEASPVPPTATFSPDTVIIFKRSGGIGGLNDQWTIYADGRIETNSATQPRLTADEVDQLLSGLEAIGFFELESSYLPEDTCCDRFFFQITAVQNAAFHTVRTVEATPDMPESLQQSLNLIQNALLEDNNK